MPQWYSPAVKKAFFYSIIIIIFSVIILEAGLHFLYFVKCRLKDRSMPDDYYLSVYKDAPWARRYFQEYAVACDNMRYEPYYGWRRNEFSGECINISADGIRKTWNPAFGAGQAVKRVYCFGGSATWGVGVRDDFTIPSLLSKRLNRENGAYFVTNYGESAYIAMQEIVYLSVLLKEGKIPDYVIFYDGANDVYAAYQNGKVGPTQNDETIRKKLSEKKGNIAYIRQGLVGIVKGNSAIYRAISRLAGKLSSRRGIKGVEASAYNGQEMELLAEEVMADYKNNAKLADALSKAYGFKYVLLWQPMLYVYTKTTAEEESLGDWRDSQRARFYRICYDKMKNASIPYFHDLSEIFGSKDKTLFTDFCHISEEGNGIVAEKIYEIMRKEFGL